MFKKVIIGGLVIIVLAAVAIGVADYMRGDSTLALQNADNESNVAASAGSQQDGYRGSTGDDRGASDPAEVEAWITIQGVVRAVDNNELIVETSVGDELRVQLGRPQFWADQGLGLQVGDAVTVQGFYENDVFTAGDIVRADTGEHLMLRDPNGRPLWSGGQAGGPAGETGAGNGQSLTDGNQLSQLQAAATEWITIRGLVMAVELNAVAVQAVDGEMVLVQLGPQHFWTEQGIILQAGDEVEVSGFFEDDDSFSAGSLTLLASGETLLLRQADGRPSWAGNSGQRGNGQGRGQNGH